MRNRGKGREFFFVFSHCSNENENANIKYEIMHETRLPIQLASFKINQFHPFCSSRLEADGWNYTSADSVASGQKNEQRIYLLLPPQQFDD
jgi:hypothetical protein